MPAIRVSDLCFSYLDGTEALRGISFDQEDGQFLVVAGRNGAGKSTLLKCLSGIIPGFQKGELSGRVELLNYDISGKTVRELAGTVGLVLQDFESQLFSTDVESEVAFGPENLGIPPAEIAKRIRSVLSDVGLAGFEGRDPTTLSGGEKQRLVMASVLAMAPRILLLDEPASDLDPVGRDAVLAILRRLRRSGHTILLVEHEMEDLTDASMLLFLRDGNRDVLLHAEAAMMDPSNFERNSIRVPDMALLCNHLRVEPEEFTPEGVFEALSKRGLGLSKEKCAALVSQDHICGTGEPVAEVTHASHSYGGIAMALQDVNLVIQAHEVVAILGANGSGKTTLVQCIAGLLQPERGAVQQKGHDTRGLSREQIARVVGYVFQNPDQQLFTPTVAEEVAFGPKNFGMPDAEIPGAVAEALSRVGLAGFEDRDPFTLTRGERQKVAVASVLVSRPELLIMDEPTTGLDWAGQVAMMELVCELRERGRTIVFVTHSMWLAAAYADRVVVMQEGRIAMDGPTRQVFGQCGKLADACLRAPAITRLGAMYGQTLLTVNEFIRCMDDGRDKL